MKSNTWFCHTTNIKGIFLDLYIYLLGVQSPSHVWIFAAPWIAAYQASLSLTISPNLPKFMSIALVIPSSHLSLWYCLLQLSWIFHSIRTFSSGSGVRIKWPKYRNFIFSISPSNEYQGWFPLRLTDLIPLLSKGLSRVFSSTTVQRHQLFIAWPSLLSSLHNHDGIVTAGRTTALTTVFVSRVMSLLFNTLSRFIVAFLQEETVFWFHGCSHHSQWFLEPRKRKSVTISTFSPFICHEVMESDAWS